MQEYWIQFTYNKPLSSRERRTITDSMFVKPLNGLKKRVESLAEQFENFKLINVVKL